MSRRVRAVLPAVAFLVLLTACGTEGPRTASSPSDSPSPLAAASSAAGVPADPCALDGRLLAGLLDDEVSGGRPVSGDMPACEWVSASGTGVVVIRIPVSDWLDLGQGLPGGVDLDSDDACGAYRQVLALTPEPDVDHVVTSVDADAGTRVTFIEGAEQQSLHVMTCAAGVVTGLNLTGSGISGSDVDVARTVDVAARLFGGD